MVRLVFRWEYFSSRAKRSGIARRSRENGSGYAAGMVRAMSTDVITLIIALGLGIAVVVLGLRRNLSETTRDGLPRFGEASDETPEALGPSEGGQGRKPLSPKQARWLAALYLLIAISNAVDAVLSSDDRVIHAVAAALFAFCAVLLLVRKLPFTSWTPTS